MQWLLLAIIVAALVFAAYRQPKFAFGLLAVLLVGLLGVVIWTGPGPGGLQSSGFEPGQVRVEGLVVHQDYGESFRFQARLVNQHPDRLLRRVELRVSMLDCATPDQQNCPIIGQVTERVTTEVPPGQARDIADTVFFGRLNQIPQTPQWRAEVVSAR